MNIKEEIKILLLKENISMRKLVGDMNKEGFGLGTVQNLSNKLSKKTIRFEEIERILNFLDYELKIKKKN